MIHAPMGDVSLEAVLARATSGLPVPVACWIVARAGEALASAPRALTPGEVHVGAQGEVRITPPRLARTPFEYVAPEVIRGGDPDARSAVFGLGALLAQLLTGRAPFARGSDLATRIAVTDDPSPTLAGTVPEATHDLDAILARALAKSPAERYASTAELAARLTAFLADELHDIGAEQVAAAMEAALEGRDASEALFAHGFAPPEHGAAIGEPKVQVPHDAPVSEPSRAAHAPAASPRRPTPPPGIIEPVRKPTPPPGVIQPARRPTPPPGVVEPVRKPTPPPGVIQPARRPTPPPGVVEPARPPPPPGAIEPARRPTPPPGGIEPARRPTPPPGAIAPARRPTPSPNTIEPAHKPTRPPAQRAALPSYESAELDLRPDQARASHPGKLKLDRELVRLGDPLLAEQAGAGITDAALDVVDRPAPPPRRAHLDIDEAAFRRERERPVTTIPEEPEPPPGPNWMLRIVVGLVALLGLALAYQFALRPLLK